MHCIKQEKQTNLKIKICISDLETNESFNAMAKTAAGKAANSSEPFRIEHFDYENFVVANQMVQNGEELTLTGITVSTL